MEPTLHKNCHMSYGVTMVKKDESVETLIARADQALYQAKKAGRNRVCSLTAEPS